MAKIAEQEANQVIVTDDNPRTENPQTIFSDIHAGFVQADQVVFEHDRAAAIRLAIQQAKQGDTVVIAGKGHETVQILADRSIPFDDRTQAALALEEYGA
jgi:UDP-N-acetylmuramoyl-L-alanyl-D-glutamate--2,6-diaminopimelate ligase